MVKPPPMTADHRLVGLRRPVCPEVGPAIRAVGTNSHDEERRQPIASPSKTRSAGKARETRAHMMRQPPICFWRRTSGFAVAGGRIAKNVVRTERAAQDHGRLGDVGGDSGRCPIDAGDMSGGPRQVAHPVEAGAGGGDGDPARKSGGQFAQRSPGRVASAPARRLGGDGRLLVSRVGQRCPAVADQHGIGETQARRYSVNTPRRDRTPARRYAQRRAGTRRVPAPNHGRSTRAPN